MRKEANMPEQQIDINALLIKSEEWNPPNGGKTKLEELKETVFNLRFNKGLSYIMIRKFLAEAGIKTSAAALSNFCRTRFDAETTNKMKASIAARLAGLAPKGENGQEIGNREA
jgi:hypothetical protein